METFHWTPTQIAEIPYAKIQEYFMILNQRRLTLTQKEEIGEKKKLKASDKELEGLMLRKSL